MNNSPSKGTSHLAYTGFSLDRSTPSLWRVTFDNPPINLIDPVMIVALHDLLAEIEQDSRVAVVVLTLVRPIQKTQRWPVHNPSTSRAALYFSPATHRPRPPHDVRVH